MQKIRLWQCPKDWERKRKEIVKNDHCAISSNILKEISTEVPNTTRKTRTSWKITISSEWRGTLIKITFSEAVAYHLQRNTSKGNLAAFDFK